MMHPIEIDARLQVTAGVHLLEFSGLVRWNSHAGRFSPITRDEFESASKHLDFVFGRLISWINFSAGAEFLAKGVCLVCKVDLRTDKLVPAYPSTDLNAWVKQFQPSAQGTLCTTNFGAIGQLYKKHLKSLCDKRATATERQQLLAAYELLGSTIRNRDAHAYVPNVRDSHFGLVSELFAGCLDLLVSWLPNGPQTLNDWMDQDETVRFIGSLNS